MFRLIKTIFIIKALKSAKKQIYYLSVVLILSILFNLIIGDLLQMQRGSYLLLSIKWIVDIAMVMISFYLLKEIAATFTAHIDITHRQKESKHNSLLTKKRLVSRSERIVRKYLKDHRN